MLRYSAKTIFHNHLDFCLLCLQTLFATKELYCAADNIGQGSPLEMCYYLGKLQEENYLLSKPPKRKGEVDVMIRVPMLG